MMSPVHLEPSSFHLLIDRVDILAHMVPQWRPVSHYIFGPLLIQCTTPFLPPTRPSPQASCTASTFTSSIRHMYHMNKLLPTYQQMFPSLPFHATRSPLIFPAQPPTPQVICGVQKTYLYGANFSA